MSDECPVCGEPFVSVQAFATIDRLTFDGIYYGPHQVCILQGNLYAHGERQ